MKRYYIEEAKYGVTEGGIACGPISGNVIGSVRFRDGDRVWWLNSAEVGGCPNYYLTDKDVFDDLVKEDFDDEGHWNYMDEHFVSEFSGIELGEYCDTFDSISSDPNNPAVPLIRCLISLVRCCEEDVEDFIEMVKGIYADEMEIPVSDVEEDYLDSLEEDDEDEKG